MTPMQNKVYECDFFFFFFPKPELASALCHIAESLGYLKLHKAFVAHWALWKQVPKWEGVWGARHSLGTSIREGKEAG